MGFESVERIVEDTENEEVRREGERFLRMMERSDSRNRVDVLYGRDFMRGIDGGPHKGIYQDPVYQRLMDFSSLSDFDLQLMVDRPREPDAGRKVRDAIGEVKVDLSHRRLGETRYKALEEDYLRVGLGLSYDVGLEGLPF